MRTRTLRRSRIPAGEVAFGGLYLLLLGGIALGVLRAGPSFDPADRDLTPEQLTSARPAPELYHPPLEPWREPGARTGAGPDLGIFPAAILDGGWSLDGRVRTYDPETLYEKINGAAEQFLTFGFQRLHVVRLIRGEQRIELELYDQNHLANALGLLAERRSPEAAPEQDRDLLFYPTAVGALGRLGKFYVQITGGSTDPAIREKARQLLKVLAELPPEGGEPPLAYRLLTRELKLPVDRVEFQRESAFRFEFAREFWFATLEPEGRLFLHQAEDGAAATALMDRLLQEQSYEYETVDRQDRTSLLRHRFLGSYLLLRRQGDLLYGLDGIPAPDSHRAVLDRLEEVLNRE